MRLSRRGFFFGMGAGGALIAAWTLVPRRFAPPLVAGEGEYAFDAWLKIGKDGVVSVAVPELEMEQGITTLIPQVVAMELGADWRQIAVEPAPISGAYGNAVLAARWAPLWLPLGSGLADTPGSLLARRFAEHDAFMASADGTSMAAHELAARSAAASTALAKAPLTGAGSTAICRQSAPSSIATTCGSKVVIPCPISSSGTATLTTPSCPILSQASKAYSPGPGFNGGVNRRGVSAQAAISAPPAPIPKKNPRRESLIRFS